MGGRRTGRDGDGDGGDGGVAVICSFFGGGDGGAVDWGRFFILF